MLTRVQRIRFPLEAAWLSGLFLPLRLRRIALWLSEGRYRDSFVDFLRDQLMCGLQRKRQRQLETGMYIPDEEPEECGLLRDPLPPCPRYCGACASTVTGGRAD